MVEDAVSTEHIITEDFLPEDDGSFDLLCFGLLDCTQAAAWLCLGAKHLWIPLVVSYLCWRPDLLVLWKADPDAQQPSSFAAYSRQVKQQQAVVRLAKQQAPQQGVHRLPGGSSSGRRSNSSSTGPISNLVGTAGNCRRRAGSTTVTPPSDSPASSSSSTVPSGLHTASAKPWLQRLAPPGSAVAYLSMLWWQRVRFAAVSYAQLLLVLLVLPWRLMDAAVRLPQRLCAVRCALCVLPHVIFVGVPRVLSQLCGGQLVLVCACALATPANGRQCRF